MATGTVKHVSTPKRVSVSSPKTMAALTCLCISAPSLGNGYRNLEENQKVVFETTQGPKGLQASNVEVR